MVEYQIEPNDELILRIQLASNHTNLYPQVKIYDADNSLVDTVNLSHVNKGLYTGTWTNPGSLAKYYTQTIVYSDSGYSTEASVYRPDSDSINVGRYSTGGIFGAKGSGTVRTKLTKEEIQKVVSALAEELKPVLEKNDEYEAEDRLSKVNELITEKLESHLEQISREVTKELEDVKFLIAESNDLGTKLLLKASKESVKNLRKTLTKELSEKLSSISEQYQSVSSGQKDVVKQLSDYFGLMQTLKLLTESLNNNFDKKVPEFIDKSLKETVDGKELENLQQQLGFAKTMERIVSQTSKAEYRKALKNEDEITVLEYLRSLSVKERVKEFDYIRINYPNLIKKLVKVTRNEKVLR